MYPKCDISDGEAAVLGLVAIQMVNLIKEHASREEGEASSPIRFYMATSLAPAMLVLCLLILFFDPDKEAKNVVQSLRHFEDAVRYLRAWTENLPIAGRILRDFESLIQAFRPLRERIDAGLPAAGGDWRFSFQEREDWFPYRHLDVDRQYEKPDDLPRMGEGCPEEEDGWDRELGQYRRPSRGYGCLWI
jgi:hypothetical protein